MSQAATDLGNRLEAFAHFVERFWPEAVRQSEVADIRLAAAVLKGLTTLPPDLPEASRASHMS